MTETTAVAGAQGRAWAATWARAGVELERLRRAELRTFDYAQHMAEVDELLDLAARFARPRTTSGLVELQRWLGRWRP
ncbi:MAG: hypothetical protein NTV22_04375 [bacterium]|nr:hypothetical protein [bacterium]